MKDRKRLKEYYDSLAKAYDELYGEEQEKKHEVVLRALPKREGVLLDLGCGTGNLSLKASEMGWLAVAADISIEMLKLAKEKGVQTLVQCSSDNPPFREGAFDFVAAITAFSDEEELKGSVERLKKLVRHGGGIIASIPLKGARGKGGLVRFDGIKDAFLFLTF